MDVGGAREVFKKYSTAVAYVEVEDPDGMLNLGTAFHVGEGVFVTARHVVEGKRITEVGMTESTYVELTGEEAQSARTFVHQGDRKVPSHRIDNRVMTVSSGPFFHPNEGVDIAVFSVESIDPHTPHILLGGHLDDWLGESDFVLFESVILGYPPIPMAKRPVLVAARGEINAQVDLYDTDHVHFVVSVTARGGFSGGPLMSDNGYLLGVVTRSLMVNDGTAESGFLSAVSVEPVYVCLAEHKMLPACQAEMWGDFWNTSTISYGSKGSTGGILIEASIDVFDDGNRFYVEFNAARDGVLLDSAFKAVRDFHMVGEASLSDERKKKKSFRFTPGLGKAEELSLVVKLLASICANRGYVAGF